MMTHRSPLRTIVALAAAVLLISCGDRTAGSMGDSPQERDSAFRTVQAGLIDAESEKAAGAIIAAAGRPRTEDDGLIREAIDFSGGRIRYFAVNAADAVRSTGTEDPGGDLSIVDYGPRGELPIENRRPKIYVMFDRPMVPLASLGQPITESDLLRIDPPVDGVYRWYGTKTLAFRPDHPLLDEPRYRITVAPGAESLSGDRLGEEFSFDVFGERVKMVNIYPGDDPDTAPGLYDVPTALASRITLEFNQPVDPDIIGASISVSDESGVFGHSVERPDYPERLESRTDRGVLLTLDREPGENSRLRVTLAEGAVPFDGYPPTLADQSYQIRTIRPFVAEELSAYPGGFPRDNRPFLYPVYLRFSHPIPEDQDLPNFSIRLDKETVRPEDIRLSWSTVAFYLPGVRPGQRVALDMDGGVQDIHGRSAESISLTTEIPRPRPTLDFPSDYDGLRHLEAEFEPAVVWTSRNAVEGSLGAAGARNFFDTPGFHPPMQAYDPGSGTPDVTVFHQVDLAPHLNDDRRGTVFLDYRMRLDPDQVDRGRQWREGSVAVQVTDLGLTVRAAHNRILVWVNRLSDGRPVAEADVMVFNLHGRSYRARTDASGLAAVELAPGVFAATFHDRSGTRTDSIHVRAEKDGDLAEMRVRNTQASYAFGVYNVVNPEYAGDPVDRIHLFTDRGLYKPGEELAMRGIHWRQDPDGFESYRGPYRVRIIDDLSGKRIWSAEGDLTESGGFAQRLRLPEDLEPGYYQIVYEAGGGRQYSAFRIAAFRRVAFQVDSRIVDKAYYHGDSVEASVEASYLAGGAMPSAAYHYYWTRRPIRYRPPGPQWSGWEFGTSDWAAEQTLSSGDGRLSGSGSARIAEGTLDHEVTGKAYRYTVETTVTDIDRQQVSGTASALVHPARYYIGARFDGGDADGWWSRFIATNQAVRARARLSDVEGTRMSPGGTMSAALIRGEWRSVAQQGLYGRVNTRWEYVENELWLEKPEMDDGEVVVDLNVEEAGRYTLRFEYADEAGRPARTEIDFYATGSGWVQRASRTPSDINLIVDKDLYEPGETARILVQSPVPEGRYLLSIEREGILEESVIRLDGSTEVIEIPVREAYLPVFYVALSSFTERTETEDDYFEPDLGRPRGLFGLTTVRVATTPVELDVEVSSAEPAYGPGDEAEFLVTVSKDGRPVSGAEVTLLAVDRGVLDLIDYHVPDPLAYFYDEYHFPHGVMGDDSRRLLMRPVTYEIANLQGGASGKLEERRDFNPLALFEPFVRTGADGVARVRAELPDNLSTYRLTAVALDGVRLGYDEDEFRVSNPINVRTALPRRLRVRDSAAAGIVLTNTSGDAHDVRVQVASDILDVAGSNEADLVLPPNSTTELPFVLEALEEGRGEIRFTVRSDVLNEILVDQVVVERPLVTEAFATVGTFNSEQPAEEGLDIPVYAAEGYGGLTISIDSTLRPYIEPIVDDLASIPYPSTNDRLYAVMGELVDGESPSAPALFAELASRQFEDGGIGYRPPSLEYAAPNWFLSVLTAHVAAETRRLDPKSADALDLSALHSYLKDRLDEAREDDEPGFMAAWTAWVLAVSGDAAREDLDWLAAAEDRVGLAGYGLLSGAYAALDDDERAGALYQRSRNFISIGTRSVDLKESYEAASYFSSGEAEMALMLRNAAERGDQTEFLLRLAGALDRNRNEGRFHSRFDDFWILWGFAPLLQAEGRSGAVPVRVDLAEASLLEETLGGGNPVSLRRSWSWSEAPLADSAPGDRRALSLSSDSASDLYYAAEIAYALPVETVLPRDEGIEVTGRIETLDGEILDPGNLPLGETFRMSVSVSTADRRSYLKLVIPVPSGTEIVDPSFATTGSYGDAGGTGGESWTRETVYGDTAEFVDDGYVTFGPEAWDFWYYRPLQTVYDNAVSYLWEDFYPGQREISFLIRSTTPGIYPTPPASASLEFEPEVFGRDGGRLAVIRGE